jgi:hypothetical protein
MKTKKTHIGVPTKPKVGDIYVVEEADGKNYYKVSIIIDKKKGQFSSKACDFDGNVLTGRETHKE